jgi:hypothetical protein
MILDVYGLLSKTIRDFAALTQISARIGSCKLLFGLVVGWKAPCSLLPVKHTS